MKRVRRMNAKARPGSPASVAARSCRYHPRSIAAHRLIHLAAAHGLQDAVTERLLRAYFTDGLPIGDPDALVAAVAEVGLAADAARAVLAGDAYAAAVRADEQRAAAFGITGVPFFVIDERYGVSGAQPAEVLLGALEHAWADAHPLTLVGAADAEAGACDSNQCAITPTTPTAAAQTAEA